LVQYLKRRDHVEDILVNGSKRHLRELWCVRMWIGVIWLRIGISGSYCEHGYKPVGYVKGREFID
jgi:hypothetical protein